LFDNASNGYNQTSRYSAGMILKLDHTTQSVSLVQDYIAPFEFVSASQGNLQILTSSNVFVGWGSNAYISEYTPSGRLVQLGSFASTGSMNYRAFKSNFTSDPTDAPALYTYAHNTSAPTSYWMSWNGATKVAQWRIYSSASRNGPWTLLDTMDKKGFETRYTAPNYHAWSLVESVDAAGNPLKNSTRPTRTFVPSQELAAVCDASSCPVAESYHNNSPSQTQTGESSATSSSGAVNLQKRAGMTGEMGIAAMVGMGAFMV
jgi:hypothetical protein